MMNNLTWQYWKLYFPSSNPLYCDYNFFLFLLPFQRCTYYMCREKKKIISSWLKKRKENHVTQSQSVGNESADTASTSSTTLTYTIPATLCSQYITFTVPYPYMKEIITFSVVKILKIIKEKKSKHKTSLYKYSYTCINTRKYLYA